MPWTIVHILLYAWYERTATCRKCHPDKLNGRSPPFPQALFNRGRDILLDKTVYDHAAICFEYRLYIIVSAAQAPPPAAAPDASAPASQSRSQRKTWRWKARRWKNRSQAQRATWRWSARRRKRTQEKPLLSVLAACHAVMNMPNTQLIWLKKKQ